MSIADKLTTIAENVSKVYEAGQAAGGGTGGNYDEGYTDGLAEGSALFKALAEGTLEEINDDTITSARTYALAHNTSLKTATLNNLTTAGVSFFVSCTALETVNLPNLKKVPYTGFLGCTALKNVYVPIAESDYGCFMNCSSLEFVDLPKWAYMNAETFGGCTSLKTVILRYNGRMTLNNVSAFRATPFRNGEGGTIYVPQALVEAYKTATNWNALESTTFLPIEGSEYE